MTNEREPATLENYTTDRIYPRGAGVVVVGPLISIMFWATIGIGYYAYTIFFPG